MQTEEITEPERGLRGLGTGACALLPTPGRGKSSGALSLMQPRPPPPSRGSYLTPALSTSYLHVSLWLPLTHHGGQGCLSGCLLSPQPQLGDHVSCPPPGPRASRVPPLAGVQPREEAR